MKSTENALENGQVDAALTKSILRKVKIWGVFWPYEEILSILSKEIGLKDMIF